MTITADSKLPLVSLSELSVEHAPIIDIQGWKLTPEAKVHWLQNTQAQRTATLGKVVDIIETYETIRIWSDESTSGTVMRALVWDDNANKPMYVQIGYRSESCRGLVKAGSVSHRCSYSIRSPHKGACCQGCSWAQVPEGHHR